MASRIVDNLLAFRILSLLVKPFRETEAFKLGIVDENGKILKKSSDLQTTDERDAYNYLTRLVFNLKRILMKLPGGESRLKSIIAAYWLVKECYEKRISNSLMEERYMALLETIEKNNITLVEEEIIVKKFFDGESFVYEERVDKHEVSGKIVVDGHVFNDSGKVGRSTYGRYSTKEHSFSTISDVKKWVKTQPKKSSEEIDRVHKKHADFEKYMNEEGIANVTGAAVSTNEPVINPKKKKKVIIDVSRRGPVVQ